MFLAVFFKIIVTKDRPETVLDPRGGGGGGQKGHMPPPPYAPPEATTRHTLPLEKKVIIDLITAKVSYEKWYQCELLILI